MRAAAHSLRKTGYILYLLALIYAPFAYGCTPPWAITGLEILTVASTAAWLLGSLFERHMPRLTWLPVIPFVLALALGWWMTLNAISLYDDDARAFVPLENWAQNLPGSVDSSISSFILGPLTALFGGFLVASDMAAHPIWRRRLFLTMALTGVALAIFGIILKAAGAPLMSLFWQTDDINPSNFALYQYHANAGAYLNLVWPLTLAFAWRAWEKLDGSVPSQLLCLGWSLATAICWAAVLVNISKFAVLVFLILLPIFLILRGRSLFQRQLHQASWHVLVLSGVLFLIMGVIVYQILASVATTGTSVDRLNRLEQGVGKTDTIDQRILSYSVELTMLKDASWHGFGPGTFHAEYPEYARPLGKNLKGYFYQAHQDYLQTWIEWGWLGCLFWSLLILGAVVRGWLMYPRRETFVRSEERLLWLGGCHALTGILIHALIDFPLQILSLSLYTLTFTAILWSKPGKDHSHRSSD